MCKVLTSVTYTMLSCSIDTPGIERQLRSYNKQCLASMWFKDCYIYMKNNFGEQEPILCVPPSKIDIFLDQYHTSLLGDHSGITKCYQTLKQRIYCPNLPYYVRLYIISCHTCQLFMGSKKFDRPLMRRFYDINTPTLTNISMDIKHMPPS